jgi:hypothetical protein
LDIYLFFFGGGVGIIWMDGLLGLWELAESSQKSIKHNGTSI